jgi:hypothetical protein
MPYSFSSVAYVWLCGAKITGPIAEKFDFFLNLIFMLVRIFKFQCDPFSNLNDSSQRSIPKLWGLSKMAYFIFGYLSNLDGHEKLITWKFNWNRLRNKWYSVDIVWYLYYGKCTGKCDFPQQYVLLLQSMCRNLTDHVRRP